MQYKSETNRFHNSCLATLSLCIMLTGIALSVYFCLPVQIEETAPQVIVADLIEEEPEDDFSDAFYDHITEASFEKINSKTARLTGNVPNGEILVDGLGVGDVGNIVLRDRQHLSQEGLIIVVITMNSATGEVVSGPDVISRGFVYVRESENLMDDVKNVVRLEIRKCEENGIQDWATIKGKVRDCLKDYIFNKTRRNPMILPIIMEV